ncbi:HTH_Tnp_Tc3_2 domain-containing protein [Trichonephila clavipes]|nr:HTH_Tnp_Tc3_2 domain-containing protein [Trichonephila clavipes]
MDACKCVVPVQHGDTQNIRQAEGPLLRIPLKANHRRLRLQWAHEYRVWLTDCHQVAFQMNHASICGTSMATFVLDAMAGNAAFQSELSNDIVA